MINLQAYVTAQEAAGLAAKDAAYAALLAEFNAYKASHPDGGTPPSGGFVWAGLNTVWPTAATTGPRIARTAYTGTFPISGTVTGKKFSSRLQPTQVSNGAVFVDCEFVGGVDGNSKRFTLDHCKLSGGGAYGGIVGTATVLYCDISGFEDAIKLQFDGWIIRGNYIHGPWSNSASHNDGVQVQWGNSNGLIEQNRIEWRDTSEVFLQELTGQIDNITVRHNWIGGSDLPLRIETGCTGCSAYENVIKQGNPTYPNSGYYDLNSTVVHHGNIDSVTGATIG